MRIIEQNAELFKHDGNPYELIEKAGRVCYKSESKGNPKDFVLRLIKSNHLAVLEHEYLYFILDDAGMKFFQKYSFGRCKYLNVVDNYISGSFRAWIEFFANLLEWHGLVEEFNSLHRSMYRELAKAYPDIFTEFVPEGLNSGGWEVNLVSREELISEVGDNKEVLIKLLPHTIKFVTSRAVSNELVRHRIASFCQLSQRYVDYHDGNIEFIRPHLAGTDILNWENWNYAMIWAETTYHNLRDKGILPQIARGVLPNDCATEIVVTATEEEWQHIINLRYHGTTGAPHPQMVELMSLAYPILQTESDGRIT